MGHPLTESMRRLMPAEARKAWGIAGLTADECAAVAEARSELELQKQVSSYLAMRGIFAMSSRMDRRTSNRLGQPDFIFAVKRRGQGIPVAVECKSATGKLSEEQKWVKEQLLSDGWVHAEIRSLSELKRLIEHLERSEG